MRLQGYITEAYGVNRYSLKLFYMTLKDIWKDCKPFLKDFYNGDRTKFMYSGRSKDIEHFVGTVRTDRKPKDTHIDLHNDLDDTFKKKFGVKPRSNSLFCSGDENIVYEYGTPYIIFPIGQYKFLWSTLIEDLYIIITKMGYGDSSENGLYAKAVKTIQELKDPKVIKAYGEFQRISNKEQEILDIMYDSGPMTVFLWLMRDVEDKYILDLINKEYQTLLNNIVDEYRDNNIKLAITVKNEIMIMCKKYHALNASIYERLLYDIITTYGLKLPSYEDIVDLMKEKDIGYANFKV